MRAISSRLLTCSCVLYTANGIDEDRQASYNEPVTLSKVWITSAQATTNGSIGKESSDRMSITYDVYNSLPRGVTFRKGDKVVFNDTEYFINSIEPVYSDGLSHYLIGLS